MQIKRSMLFVALVAFAFSLSAGAQTAKPRPINPTGGGALYIAGDGFSLEQAVSDGIRENQGKTAFAVLVLNAEISKLGFHGATREVTNVVGQALNSRGSFYVCARDARRLNFSSSDFLPGVEIVRGFTSAEAANADAQANQPKIGRAHV